MLIYTHTITARTRYIFDLILKDMLGLTIQVTDNLETFNKAETPKLAYSRQRPPGAVYIGSCDLLFEKGIGFTEVDCFTYKEHKVLFASNGDLPFDVFAASFYLLTRYEEYLPSPKDQYGRFKASTSVAHRHGFLSVPVIHYWVEALKAVIHERYPQLEFRELVFKATVSFDIDVAFAFKARNLFQMATGAGKDLLTLRFANLEKRLRTLSGKRRDPFDTYDYIRERLQHSDADHLFFFLLALQRTQFDRNIFPTSGHLKTLVKELATFSKTGIHPSYFSSEKKHLIKEEKECLERILKAPVTISRQHYLRWQLPDTFIQLQKVGITDDYSMGYAELPGFRAGIAMPFRFYNLLKEEETSLIIHPVSFMEGSFIEDMQLTPEQACEEIRKIIGEVKKAKGNLLCIWHNHTLSNVGIYKGWRKPFEETLRLLKEY